MGTKLSSWRISRIAGSKAVRLTVVEAPSAQAAVTAYIKEHKITDKLEQSRIGAMPEN